MYSKNINWSDKIMKNEIDGALEKIVRKIFAQLHTAGKPNRKIWYTCV
jgi:hypothetical protein